MLDALINLVLRWVGSLLWDLVRGTEMGADLATAWSQLETA